MIWNDRYHSMLEEWCLRLFYFLRIYLDLSLCSLSRCFSCFSRLLDLSSLLSSLLSFLCFFFLFSLLDLDRFLSSSYLYRYFAVTFSSCSQAFPYSLCGFSDLAVGLARISTLLLSKPNPIALVYSGTASYLLPLTFLSKAWSSAGVSFSSLSQTSLMPKAAFMRCWSLRMASDIWEVSSSPLEKPFLWRYQSFLRHLPPLSSTPILAELPRYISRSRQGISLTFSQSNSDQPPRLPPLMGTQIFLFSFSSRLVITIELLQESAELRKITQSHSISPEVLSINWKAA